MLEISPGFANTVPPHGQSLIVDLTTFEMDVLVCFSSVVYMVTILTLLFTPGRQGSGGGGSGPQDQDHPHLQECQVTGEGVRRPHQGRQGEGTEGELAYLFTVEWQVALCALSFNEIDQFLSSAKVNTQITYSCAFITKCTDY